MVSHQRAIEPLTIKLNAIFRAITGARDAKGHVRDKALLEAREANIKALRDAVLHHKLFLSDDEHQCGVSSDKHMLRIAEP